MSRYEEIYRKALGKWGFDNQVEMIIEECAELIQALQKHKRVKKINDITDTMKHIQEEIADVEIMIDQARIMFGSEQIDVFKKAKVERLEGRVNK